MTIGILFVARLAASIIGFGPTAMRSTVRLTSSAARTDNRSAFPFANRCTMRTLRLTTYPSQRGQQEAAAVDGGAVEWMEATAIPVRRHRQGLSGSSPAVRAR